MYTLYIVPTCSKAQALFSYYIISNSEIWIIVVSMHLHISQGPLRMIQMECDWVCQKILAHISLTQTLEAVEMIRNSVSQSATVPARNKWIEAIYMRSHSTSTFYIIYKSNAYMPCAPVQKFNVHAFTFLRLCTGGQCTLYMCRVHQMDLLGFTQCTITHTHFIIRTSMMSITITLSHAIKHRI